MIVLTVVAGFVAPAILWAHRFGGPNDPCERKIGASFIHITLYQPQFDPDAEYCDVVPREGNTVLVVDMLGDDLRKVPMGLEVIATGDSQAPRTILSVPAASLPARRRRRAGAADRGQPLRRPRLAPGQQHRQVTGAVVSYSGRFVVSGSYSACINGHRRAGVNRHIGDSLPPFLGKAAFAAFRGARSGLCLARAAWSAACLSRDCERKRSHPMPRRSPMSR